jgi:hypothetical protein
VDREIERGAQRGIGARRCHEHAGCERQRAQHVYAVELADVNASSLRAERWRSRQWMVSLHRRV